MRKQIKLTLLLSATILIFFQANAQQTAKMTSGGIGYMEYLPQGYHSNSNNYPVVISLPGIKEKGNTLADVAKVATVSLAKYVKEGQQYPFILITPQLKTTYGSWPAAYVMEVVNYVKTYLRIDPRRVYLTGLSLGGFGVWKTVGAYPEVFAAVAPICSGGNDLTHACAIAAENVPVWAFHGDADGTVSYQVSLKMVNAINACTPKPTPLAKITIFPGLGHVIWNKVYKETNVLDWMLSYTNGTTTTSNVAPTVNAGSDQTIALPTNAIAIQASASDPDGSIASYQWSKVSGGAASLSGVTSSKLSATNLEAGTYAFRLTVKDDKGASKSDDVNVIVASSTTNKLPVVSAGSDKSTTNNYFTIVGSASDTDGTIASYQWSKISGGSASLSNATTPKLFTSNLLAGTYVFRLTVKDNEGGLKYDEMTLTVQSSNTTPTVSAGSDKTTTNSGFTIVGSASDADGTIASYNWTKVSGGSVSLSNATTPKLFAYDLLPGTYVFRLTVKDNNGASKYDDMTLIVESASL